MLAEYEYASCDGFGIAYRPAPSWTWLGLYGGYIPPMGGWWAQPVTWVRCSKCGQTFYSDVMPPHSYWAAKKVPPVPVPKPLSKKKSDRW
jgi:hypothetical protein